MRTTIKNYDSSTAAQVEVREMGISLKVERVRKTDDQIETVTGFFDMESAIALRDALTAAINADRN
jgi:hypothetical protein